MNGLGQQGVLQVIPPAMLEQQMQQRAAVAAQAAAPLPQDLTSLAGYVRGRFEIFRNHRNTASGWSERLLSALRAFNGQYDATTLQQIRLFGGSQIYARSVCAQKCRAASSLLRDIYLSADRPWGVKPPSNPQVPPEILQGIQQLIQHEQQTVQQQLPQMGSGGPSGGDWEKRRQALTDEAENAAKKKALKQARESEDRIEDLLREGGFYHALAEFLVDLPVFPFACLKGPVVKIVPKVTWQKGGGKPTVTQQPRLTWNRVAPFDLWFTPGVSDVSNAEVIEKLRITRAELNDCLDLPGYNQAELRAVLDEYGTGGLYDGWDNTDAERAVLESRENPAWNRSAMITMFEYHGNIQGRMLQEYGMVVQDPLRDYNVECWIIGTHVIKCHLNPSPRQRHPYFITSFEKVPGTPVGNSLIDLLADVQEAANATLRSLINNMSIASGPQVVVNDDRITPGEDNDTMFPWKRWHVRNDPVGSSAQPPVSFFMPTSNAQQLMEVYKMWIDVADEISAIPKYVGGSGGGGGAGRTASGLAMLMGNSSKILQTVSANVDRDVIEGLLMQLSDLILLTDATGILTGEENISVMGVNVAIQRETQRQRQIEFLQTTMNPVDNKIMGIQGRGSVLRAVSKDLGLNGEEVVPSSDALERMQKQHEEQQSQGPVAEIVEKGVQKGIELGISRITTELTAGEIAAQLGMPEGNPTHVGTMPGQEGGGNATTNNPSMDLGQGQGGSNQPGAGSNPQQGSGGSAARQGQGMRQGSKAGGGIGPQTHLVGTGATKPGNLSPGVG